MISHCHRCYVITTPRRWTAGEGARVCVVVSDPQAPSGQLIVKLTEQFAPTKPIVPIFVLQVPRGRTEVCGVVGAGKATKASRGMVRVSGKVCGRPLTHGGVVNIIQPTTHTFIQTDKYLYQPGQRVQFRILSLEGSSLTVSTVKYPEVWVETPSRTRVAQWTEVDNSVGLVHLAMTLADEPQQGLYTISVKTPTSKVTQQQFKVEEYVLPRFEVTVTPPKYILARDTTFVFTVCAKYTFGQHVRGRVTLQVNNNQWSTCNKTLTKTATIFGCVDLTVTAKEVLMGENRCYIHSLSANATVEEKDTGVSLSSDTAFVSITRTLVIFRSIYQDKYVKPNLPFIFKVRAEMPDRSPAPRVFVDVCVDSHCFRLLTDNDGAITAAIPNYSLKRIRITTTDAQPPMHDANYFISTRPYYSPSRSSLAILAPSGKLGCHPGEPQKHLLSVLFAAWRLDSFSLTVQVVSRGHIQYWKTQKYNLLEHSNRTFLDGLPLLGQFPSNPRDLYRGEIKVPLLLPAEASPVIRVLVWYTREDGEVVSDTRQLQVHKCLASNVDLKWSTKKAQPGGNTTLTLSSPPGSVCSVGVVDRSVELLSNLPDEFTVDRFFKLLRRYQIPSWMTSQVTNQEHCAKQMKGGDVSVQIKERDRIHSNPTIAQLPMSDHRRPITGYFSKYVDAIKMFDDAGLYVFTDATVETRPCEKEIEVVPWMKASAGAILHRRPLPTDSEMAPSKPRETPEPDLPEQVEETPLDLPRTKFPETWLWDIVVIPPSGVQTQQLTLPDTITQWAGKAVCVSPDKGVGVSQRANITTFTPFFVELTLPPSVKRGETLHLKISIFNYLTHTLPVSVVVLESDEVQVVDDPLDRGNRGRRWLCVGAQDKDVVTVKVKPLVLGQANLIVTASLDPQPSGRCFVPGNTPSWRDTIVKPIRVEAEGFLKEETWTKYLCSIGSDSSVETWEVKPPANMVAGSARAWVTAVGDLLALTLENLGSLIRMPYGCGEQNMLNFAPNIFILQYLMTKKIDTPEVTEKLLNYMRKGYQRQLQYRHDDGSYSAFGNRDKSGSTWLTAFVLKSFAQARPYITVDERDVAKMLTWVKAKQQVNGCFRSVGVVLHKAMKGGIAGKDSLVPLTSYVLISLLEAGEEHTSSSVAEAVKCLAADASQDTYTLALKAYALTLAKETQAELTLKVLLEQAVVEDDLMHWPVTAHKKSAGLEVETAGYVLLAMMTLDPSTYQHQGSQVVRWITAHRNGQGGFVSTQDTVVALQALATYSSQVYQGARNLQLTITASDLSHVLAINENNKLLQQLVTLPVLPTTVTHTVTGTGCAIVQAVLRYNVLEVKPSEAFSVTVDTRQGRVCNTHRIIACTAYLLPDGTSNMAVIEVGLVSGWIPIKSDLRKVVHDDNNSVIKAYDVDYNKVSFYMMALTASRVCVNFRVERYSVVMDVKPATVTVYDYYQPELYVNKRYDMSPLNLCPWT